MKIEEVLIEKNIRKTFKDDFWGTEWKVIKEGKNIRLITLEYEEDEHYIEDDYFERWLPTIDFKLVKEDLNGLLCY